MGIMSITTIISSTIIVFIISTIIALLYYAFIGEALLWSIVIGVAFAIIWIISVMAYEEMNKFNQLFK